MRFLGGQGGGGGGGSIAWVPITQAMIDAGTAVSGTNNTMKSASVSDGRLTLTYNTLAATSDGIRESGGVHLDPASIIPGIDWTTHDLLVWMGAPAGSNNTAMLMVSLVDTPGSLANGCGAYCTSTRAGTLATTAASSSAGGTPDAVHARFSVSTGRVAVVAQSRASDVDSVELGTAATTFASPNLASARIYIECGSYSGGQADNNTVSADLYFAAVPKLTAPA